MVDVPKLRGKMAEKELNIEKLAAEIGMNKATLYRKMADNGENFSIKEADSLSNALNLNIEEKCKIFFARNVARNANRKTGELLEERELEKV